MYYYFYKDTFFIPKTYCIDEIIKNRMMLFFRDSPRVPRRPCSIKMAILQKIYIVVLYIDVYFVYLSYLLIELQIVSSPFQY